MTRDPVGYDASVLPTRSTNTWRRRLIEALVAGTVLSVFVACTPTVESSRVLVVGDSILNQSADPVRAALESRGWTPVTVAFGGSAIEQWTAALPQLVAEHQPSIVVFELGTNNCAEDACPELPSQIEAALDAVEPVERVLWLNVQTDPSYPAGAEVVNAALDAAAENHPKMQVVDFSDEFQGKSEWLDNGGPHLTPAGQLYFAKLIQDAVDEFKVEGS
jgi:hypothetical protein